MTNASRFVRFSHVAPRALRGISSTVFRSWLGTAAAVGGVVAAFPGLAQQPPNIGIAPVVLTESSYTFDTAEQHKIRVVVVAKGLKHPFSLALLPSGDALVSERGGPMRLVHNVGGGGGGGAAGADAGGKGGAGAGGAPLSGLDPDPIAGLPALSPAYRNGGLHDIVLHPQFAKTQLVYFTFNEPGKAGDPTAKPPTHQESILAVFRARFAGHALTHVERIFTAGESGYTGGSRLAFGKDGSLYLTTGAPFSDQAQRLDSVYGKVLRLTADGKVPADNPFVGRSDARPEVFSYGHRDHLGLAVQPETGVVLNAEHGPNGGDEVNLILPGRDYGWPKVSFGRSYEGPRISESPVAEGVEQPIIVWLPSIAPSGLTFYRGERFPAWKGNLFIGSSRRGEVPRTGGLERVVFNDKLEDVRRETLLTDLHQRIRDVRQGADGLLYLITDEDDGALLRIEPAT
jgi:glucose/arabinose dehydrogenase